MHARSLIIGVLAAVSTVAVARRAEATVPEEHERVDYTAYSLGRNEFRFSPFQFQYGILDELMVGTYIPPWFLFPWLDAPIPTAYVKVRDWFHGPLAVSLRANFAYLDATALSNETLTDKSTATASSSSMLVLPLEAAASLRIANRLKQSAEFSYVHVAATGHANQEATARGTALLSTATLTSLTELGLTRVFALNFLARIMLYASPFIADAESVGAGGTVSMRLGATLDAGPRFSLIPGVSLRWKHFAVDAGVGYGHPWLPVVRVPYAGAATIAPEFNAYFRF